MISKVLICPYFGDLPPWMEAYWANAERLKDQGYNFLLDFDEDDFRARVHRVLDIEPPTMRNTGNIWDFRPALGLLYADEIKGFDFWGHTDFDCVYGRVERWITDELLDGLDVFSNHATYICGPWSLYRNTPVVNELFGRTNEWHLTMTDHQPSGWAEKGFTQIVNHAHDLGLIRRRYECWQTENWDNFDSLWLASDGRLVEGDTERMMAHFRRTKEYPRGCFIPARPRT